MRLGQEKASIDHSILDGVNSDDHHPEVQSFKVVINNQAISPNSVWEKRFSLGKSDYKTIQTILRGHSTVDIQGHVGVLSVASNLQLNSSGYGIRPYGPGGYPTSYMGLYSRLHGDAYLSPDLFGDSVHLRDVYIDTILNEAVLEFYNVSSLSKLVLAYGLVVVK